MYESITNRSSRLLPLHNLHIYRVRVVKSLSTLTIITVFASARAFSTHLRVGRNPYQIGIRWDKRVGENKEHSGRPSSRGPVGRTMPVHA